MSAAVLPPAAGRLTPRPVLRAVVCAALGVEVLCVLLVATHADPGLVPAARSQDPSWLDGPLPQFGALTSGRFRLLMLAMAVAYAVAVATADALPPAWARRTAWAAIAVAVLAPPLLSGDVFGYLAWARMGVRGMNPYEHAAVDVGRDPVAPFQLWHHGASPYGPLFTLGSYALAPVGVPAGLWAFKALAGAAAVATVEALRRTAAALGDPPGRAVLIFALNPLLLVWGIGGAHNDLLVAAVVSAGILLTVRGRPARGAVALVAASALKFSAVVALPFLLLRPGGGRRPVLAAAGAAGAVAAVTIVAFGPAFLDIGHILGAEQSLVAVHSGPAELARAVGADRVTSAERLVGSAMLAATVAVLAVRVHRGRTGWVAAAGWTYVVLLVTTAWLLPWYIVWLLPFAAAAGQRRLTEATIVLTLLVTMSQMVG